MADRHLIKLVILSYADRNLTELDPSKTFIVPINPETYTQNLRIELDRQQAHGTSGSDPRFKYSQPEQLRLEFILDGTRTMEGYADVLKILPVRAQLTLLERCVYDYYGEIHRPRFLRIMWGTDLNFPCVLSDLDINYTLFNPDGSPLRAKINATFLSYESFQALEARERNQSPDLTHQRTAKSGDRLDLMTYKIYSDSKYYVQVAKINKLSGLRKLKPGSQLVFPPFNKNET